tara:strand:+ start:267 stop:485 length:219 start_codon:yes stop_codon:yes gene_type:complete
MVNLNIKDLVDVLALEEVKRIFGEDEETLYRNNYDEFRGFVMRPKVKQTYDKMYNKYYDLVTSLIKNNDYEI